MTIFYVAVGLVMMEVLAVLIRSRRTWEDKPFHSNGCNFTPEGNWGECCYEHDWAYRTGGWALARLKADIALSRCIFRNQNPFAALLYFIGVRVGGMWAFRYGKKRRLFLN
jgi:hypothetical protein